MDGRYWYIAFMDARAVPLSRCCTWRPGCALYRAIRWRLPRRDSGWCIHYISRIEAFGSICGAIGGSIVMREKSSNQIFDARSFVAKAYFGRGGYGEVGDCGGSKWVVAGARPQPHPGQGQ